MTKETPSHKIKAEINRINSVYSTDPELLAIKKQWLRQILKDRIESLKNISENFDTKHKYYQMLCIFGLKLTQKKKELIKQINSLQNIENYCNTESTEETNNNILSQNKNTKSALLKIINHKNTPLKNQIQQDKIQQVKYLAVLKIETLASIGPKNPTELIDAFKAFGIDATEYFMPKKTFPFHNLAEESSDNTLKTLVNNFENYEKYKEQCKYLSTSIVIRDHTIFKTRIATMETNQINDTDISIINDLYTKINKMNFINIIKYKIYQLIGLDPLELGLEKLNPRQSNQDNHQLQKDAQDDGQDGDWKYDADQKYHYCWQYGEDQKYYCWQYGEDQKYYCWQYGEDQRYYCWQYHEDGQYEYVSSIIN